MAREEPQPAQGSDGRFTLLGDQPHVAAEDPLGFDKIADDLSELVLSSRVSTPFTLGIEAGWGMGKSSLMRRLEAKLEARGVTSVWFNAWTSEEQDVLEGLIKSVLDRIDPNVLRRALRNQQLMSWLRVAVSVVAGWLRVGSLVDQIWRQVAIDPKTRNEMRALMVDAMERWMERSPRGSDRLLVVFVDDLDRCSPANVFQVFEAIKLYLDAPGFVFVVGFDRNVISEAILEQKQYSKAITSRDYLEKIIQIGYRIPQAGDEQVERLVDSYVGDSRTAHLFESSARSLVVERNARNPRRIKRFINGFILEYGLDREWADLGAETLVKVLILYMYFPDFARLLDDRAKDDPFTEFLGYCDVRSALRRGVALDSEEWPVVVGALNAHELAVPVDGEFEHTQLLRSIEAELPESFARLAADDDFVSLVRSIGGPDDRERLRSKLERRRYVPAVQAVDGSTAAAAAELPADIDLTGLRVAWIGPDAGPAPPELDALDVLGADVARAPTYERFALIEPVDLVVIEVEQRDDVDAGLHELARMRLDGYQGRVVLYTPRLTTARRRAAEEHGAAITDNLRHLAALAAEATPSRAEPPAQPERSSRAPWQGRISIFLDYRRDDSRAHAGRLYDALRRHFGDDNVFMDVDAIAPGADFAETIEQAVASADAFIEIIGQSWLSAVDSRGGRRLDDPGDAVRIALSRALAGGGAVIPVLVDGARMPNKDEMPEELAGLARRNALELTDARWDYDVEQLIRALESFGTQLPAARTRRGAAYS
jgi:hypothetical protein